MSQTLDVRKEGMKEVSEVLRGYSAKYKPKVNRKTERGEIMHSLMVRLNPPRIEAGYPPLTYARMGQILDGIPTKDLYALLSKCNQSNNFSMTFWVELKAK